MDREGIKSIASMRKGKGKQLVPAPPVGTLPGGPYPKGNAGIRTSAKQAYQSEAVFAGTMWHRMSPILSPSARDLCLPGNKQGR